MKFFTKNFYVLRKSFFFFLIMILMIKENKIFSLKNNLKNKSFTQKEQESRTEASRITNFLRRHDEYSDIDKIHDGFLENEDQEIEDYAAVIKKNNKFYLSKDVKSEDKISEVYMKRQRFEKGWDKLSVFSYKKWANAFVQSYMSGYLEGRITAPELNTYMQIKTKKINMNDKLWQKIFVFFEDVNKNLEKKIKTLKNIKDPNMQLKWSQLLLGYAQIKGLLRGYMYEAAKKNYKKVKISNLLLVQADGELPELQKAFSYLMKTKKPQLKDKNYLKEAFGIDSSNPQDFWNQLVMTGRCSAFIKLLTDEKGNAVDLMVGHTTWGESIEMLRIYKYNKFEFEDNEDLPSVKLTFSAFPGTLSSTDDYYITNFKLVVTETTLEVVDLHLYDHMKPSETYLPNFMRVLAATRFSKTAKQWVDHFKSFNSGTYSSQWLVLDYNIFNKIKGTKNIPKGMFYMLEQTPNKMITHDVTKYLFKKHFFGGYNRAFFKESNDSLHQALINSLYGPILGDYKASRRGLQFQYLEKTVKGLKSIMDIMRYNGYKQNNFPNDSSNKQPSSAISARYDLSKRHSSDFVGGIDAKVTNSEFVNDLIAITVNGPTDNEKNKNIPLFTYKKEDADFLKLPQKVKFPYIKISPETMFGEGLKVDDIFIFEKDESLNHK